MAVTAAPSLSGAGSARPSPWQRWYAQNERLVLGVVGFVGVLLLWELAVRAGLLRAVFVSSPSGIFQAARDAMAQGILLPDLATSLEEYFIGYVLAAIVGITLGLACGINRGLNYVVGPWISALYTMPHVALIPLVILWFGVGLTYKVFFVFLISFFPIVMNALSGVQAAESSYLEVARSFQASQWTVLRSVILPGAVPHVMTGLRLGAGRAWIGVVVAELVGANAGLGFMIGQASDMLNTGQVMLGVVVIGIFGLLFIEAMHRVELRFDCWRPPRPDA